MDECLHTDVVLVVVSISISTIIIVVFIFTTIINFVSVVNVADVVGVIVVGFFFLVCVFFLVIITKESEGGGLKAPSPSPFTPRSGAWVGLFAPCCYACCFKRSPPPPPCPLWSLVILFLVLLTLCFLFSLAPRLVNPHQAFFLEEEKKGDEDATASLLDTV